MPICCPSPQTKFEFLHPVEKSAAEAGDRTSNVDKKFRETIHLLSRFEKEFPSKKPNTGGTVTREANRNDKSKSPSWILHALKKNLHSKPMGNEWPKLTKIVKFHLLSSLPDAHPISVKLLLSNNPSLQEILWNFSRFKDEKHRLTLRNNPHFYAELPTSPEAYGDSVTIDPTEDFRHTDECYVLTDKTEFVYIMTDQVLQIFGNFWCLNNAIIFKDICGRLRGGSIVKASLRGTSCGFCKQLLVSTIPGASTNRRGLQPIITQGYLWIDWKCFISCLPMSSSVDFGLCVCTG
ncbi:hypothetical protein DFH94DRAFT_93912 [Russula ochroleuca]|uniref:Uncharacterized protein n=1 Tax=Russula ochroleuca TaxID=152965 RepID=A0A9P5MSV1_9AGAM|nr:hypothetical protein DFH94DRAFT_93912 [Russula ochroleuca]